MMGKVYLQGAAVATPLAPAQGGLAERLIDYEANLDWVCLAARIGRPVPLECGAFTDLYALLPARADLREHVIHLVHAHWAAAEVAFALVRGRGGARELGELLRLRREIGDCLKKLR